MSFLFPGKNNRDGYYLSLLLLEKEISAFFICVKESTPKVLVYKNIQHNLDISKGVNSEMLANLKKTLSKFFSLLYTESAKAAGKKSLKLESSAIILGYPWFFSDDMKLSFTGKDISISEGQLAQEIERKFQETEGKKAEPLKPVLLERYVNSIKLNGYQVAKAYNKKAERIEIEVTAISTFPEVEQVIDSEIRTFFHGVRPFFVSLPRLLSCRGSHASYLVMDSSNTLLVHCDNPWSIKVREINYGVEEMVKVAAEVFGSENDSTAISYLKMAKDDVLLDAVSSKVLAAVRERMVDWKFLLKKSLTELEGEDVSPLLLVYRRGLSSFTSNFIKDELPIEGQVLLLELESLSSDPFRLGI